MALGSANNSGRRAHRYAVEVIRFSLSRHALQVVSPRRPWHSDGVPYLSYQSGEDGLHSRLHACLRRLQSSNCRCLRRLRVLVLRMEHIWSNLRNPFILNITLLAFDLSVTKKSESLLDWPDFLHCCKFYLNLSEPFLYLILFLVNEFIFLQSGRCYVEYNSSRLRLHYNK